MGTLKLLSSQNHEEKYRADAWSEKRKVTVIGEHELGKKLFGEKFI